jgi:hypothetical protein
MVLQKNYWDNHLQAVTIRYYVIDALTGQITRYAQSLQAYQDIDYRSVLSEQGFGEIQILPGLLGESSQKDLIAIVACKQSSLVV